MNMDEGVDRQPAFLPITKEDRSVESGGPVYACGEYDADGSLIRATERFPVFGGRLDPQTVAEDVAGGAAAPHTVLVWENRNVVPSARLADVAVAPQGRAGR